MSRWRRVVVWLGMTLLLGSMVLAGCHTVHGAGEDIEGAGQAVERAAE